MPKTVDSTPCDQLRLSDSPQKQMDRIREGTRRELEAESNRRRRTRRLTCALMAAIPPTARNGNRAVFAAEDKRFIVTTINDALKPLAQRLDAVEHGVGGVGQRLVAVEHRLDRVERLLARVEQGVRLLISEHPQLRSQSPLDHAHPQQRVTG